MTIRFVWLVFLWLMLSLLTSTWWAGLVAIAGCIAYGIADEGEKQKRVRTAYQRMIEAQQRARKAAAEAAASAAQATVAQAEVRLMREHPELLR